MWKFIIALLSALIPVFLVQSNRIFALDKDVVYHHNDKCKKHTVPASLIDFYHYDFEEIIAAEENLMELFRGAGAVKDGRLVRVLDVAYASPKIIEIPRVDFPSEIGFHPFGVHMDGTTLYVLNQAFHRGGTRIEIFEYKDFTAIYQGTVVFSDQNIGGTFGALVVIDKHIYLTQYNSIPLLNSINPMSFSMQSKVVYKDLIQSYDAGVYKCQITTESPSTCVKLNTSNSTSVTGITKNSQNELFIAFSSMDYNWVEVYNFDSRGEIELKQKFPLRDRTERLSYNLEFDKVYGGAVPWPLMMVTSSYVPGGAIEIKEANGYSHRRLYMQEKLFRGGSVAARMGNYVITGTFLDNSVLVCPVIDP